MIQAEGKSDTGCVREKNEDRILIDHNLGLFVLADGMGGHSHGELAAELAVTTIRSYVESSQDRFDVTWPFGYNFNISLDSNRLVTAIQLANDQVWRHSQQAPVYAGMGTTVAAALFNGGNLGISNVGDSRVYLFRNGELAQLTIDDTWINAVSQKGALTRDQVQSHPMRNFLTQAAGSKENLDVHTAEIELQDGDVVLLSSDGLHGVVEDKAAASILRESMPDLARCCERLIGGARTAGGPDNISCILLRYTA